MYRDSFPKPLSIVVLAVRKRGLASSTARSKSLVSQRERIDRKCSDKAFLWIFSLPSRLLLNANRNYERHLSLSSSSAAWASSERTSKHSNEIKERDGSLLLRIWKNKNHFLSLFASSGEILWVVTIWVWSLEYSLVSRGKKWWRTRKGWVEKQKKRKTFYASDISARLSSLHP